MENTFNDQSVNFVPYYQLVMQDLAQKVPITTWYVTNSPTTVIPSRKNV